MSIFGMEYQYGQGMLASAIKVGEKSQGGEGGRDHWGGWIGGRTFGEEYG